MISGLVLKYLNGECFLIRRAYETTLPVSSSFCLTVPDGVIMSEVMLEKVDGEHVCNWCFARNETVLHDTETNTYWHQDCREVAGDAIHHMKDWLPFKKKKR